MRQTRRLRLGAILALGATAAVTFASVASAKQTFRETFHEEGTDVFQNFCDVPGMTVNVAFTDSGRVFMVPHGPDGLSYFHLNGTHTNVFTNPANGRSVTERVTLIDKDLRVTDNGDGTLTIIALATGNATVYGANGKAIARNPGQIRYELLIDHNGTPTDPSDDEFIADLGLVKGSTGRSDDFCEAVVPALS